MIASYTAGFFWEYLPTMPLSKPTYHFEPLRLFVTKCHGLRRDDAYWSRCRLYCFYINEPLGLLFTAFAEQMRIRWLYCLLRFYRKFRRLASIGFRWWLFWLRLFSCLGRCLLIIKMLPRRQHARTRLHHFAMIFEERYYYIISPHFYSSLSKPRRRLMSFQRLCSHIIYFTFSLWCSSFVIAIALFHFTQNAIFIDNTISLLYIDDEDVSFAAGISPASSRESSKHEIMSQLVKFHFHASFFHTCWWNISFHITALYLLASGSRHFSFHRFQLSAKAVEMSIHYQAYSHTNFE